MYVCKSAVMMFPVEGAVNVRYLGYPITLT